MFRKALAAAGALLALFHGWLLVGQAWDGQLADPGVLFRWFIAGALVWSLLALRRQGAPVFFGRRAVAIWLLAALLHGPAVAERIGAPGIPALPEVAATLAQVALGATTIVGLALLAGLLAAPRRLCSPLVTLAHRHRPLPGALSPGTYLSFSPRPPPVA
jgi:hypothetical protein